MSLRSILQDFVITFRFLFSLPELSIGSNFPSLAIPLYFSIICFGSSNRGISQGVPVFCRVVRIHNTPSLAATICLGVRLHIYRYAKPVKNEKRNISRVRYRDGWSNCVFTKRSSSSRVRYFYSTFGYSGVYPSNGSRNIIPSAIASLTILRTWRVIPKIVFDFNLNFTRK